MPSILQSLDHIFDPNNEVEETSTSFANTSDYAFGELSSVSSNVSMTVDHSRRVDKFTSFLQSCDLPGITVESIDCSYTGGRAQTRGDFDDEKNFDNRIITQRYSSISHEAHRGNERSKELAQIPTGNTSRELFKQYARASKWTGDRNMWRKEVTRKAVKSKGRQADGFLFTQPFQLLMKGVNLSENFLRRVLLTNTHDVGLRRLKVKAMEMMG